MIAKKMKLIKAPRPITAKLNPPLNKRELKKMEVPSLLFQDQTNVFKVAVGPPYTI
jgi:hypothetical protein